MKKILYIVGMGVLFGCSDSYLVDNGVNLSEGKPCGMVRMADLSSTGIYAINGFAKHGEKLVMGSSYMQQGVAYAVDLSSPLTKALPMTETYVDKAYRTLSSFSSFDGKSLTALDFKTGELLENAVSDAETGEKVVCLPKGRQHLAAVKTGDFVLSTGVYEEGRYLLYSLADSTEHYSLSYPGHPDYPEIGEKTKGVLYASSILRIHPDGNRFVCADMYSGGLDRFRQHQPDKAGAFELSPGGNRGTALGACSLQQAQPYRLYGCGSDFRTGICPLLRQDIRKGREGGIYGLLPVGI